MFKKKPKMLDAEGQDGIDDGLVVGDAITANEAVKRKQMLLLSGAGAVALIAGSFYIFDDSGSNSDKNAELAVTDVSTDDMMNKNMSEKEWRAQSEAQLLQQDQRIRALTMQAQRAGGVAPPGGVVGAPGSTSEDVTEDTRRVLGAYQQENDQLKAALAAAKASPVMAQPPGGPNSMYGRGSPPTYAMGPGRATPAGDAAAAAAAGLPMARANEVKLVSFGDGPAGTGSPVPKGTTIFTDSANYLPPNSIAVAKVIVGVDASVGVQSQSDPLPVVLRITGPARSVYDNGRLLTTNISGCLVNGAARGDLSSEKIYVKLQRMTCPQPNGRYAVSDVKGFVAFGGKTGVRGRVVSREGSLIGQAFIAGLAGGFGRGFAANTQSVLQGSNVQVNGERQKLGAGELLEGGLGEGVATSADMVSKYLIERAEQYQPVIEMPTGIDVEIVFLEGVFISG